MPKTYPTHECDEVDEQLLRYISRHACMTFQQIHTIARAESGLSEYHARKHLRALLKGGFLRQGNRKAPYQITQSGLIVCRSDLPVPSIDSNVVNLEYMLLVDLMIAFETSANLTTLSKREILFDPQIDSTSKHHPAFVIKHDDGTCVAINFQRNPARPFSLERQIEALDGNPSYARCIYITEPVATDPVRDAIERTKSTKAHQIDLDEVRQSLDTNRLPTVFDSGAQGKRAV
jgi:hypothetical protein